MSSEKWAQFVEHMEAARVEVEKAMDMLDTSAKKCSECSLNHYNDYEAFQLHKNLGGVLTRLSQGRTMAYDRTRQ